MYYVCMHIYVILYVWIHEYVDACMFVLWAYTCMDKCMYACMCIRAITNIQFIWILVRWQSIGSPAQLIVFIPGMRRLHVPGFLKLILCGSSVCMFVCVRVCVCVCVCVSAPEAINN